MWEVLLQSENPNYIGIYYIEFRYFGENNDNFMTTGNENLVQH